MRTKLYFSAATVIALLCCCAKADAVEIKGTVRSGSADTATIAIEGESAPNVGDPVEIFFKLPGADTEISVGSGKVTAVHADSVEAKIDKATGTVAKDQLARIASANPKKRGAASVAGGPPVRQQTRPSPSEGTPSLIGKWVGHAPNGDKITYVFKPDDTVLWTVEATDFPGAVSAKYTVDYSTKPIHIDIFDFGLSALKDYILLGVIEFDSASRLRLYG